MAGAMAGADGIKRFKAVEANGGQLCIVWSWSVRGVVDVYSIVYVVDMHGVARNFRMVLGRFDLEADVDVDVG